MGKIYAETFCFDFLMQRLFCFSLPDGKFNDDWSKIREDSSKTPEFTMVDDLLSPQERDNRPPKIAIILRGPPGSGKSFVAKLIKVKL